MTLSTVFVLSPFATTYFNAEPLIYASTFVPPMVMYDALAQASVNGITLIPFIAAYGLINTDQRRRDVIAILVMAALAYSLPVLFEIRLSPQLHTMIYGFFPHEFIQQVRGDGFRAVVFLGHGLLVAIFFAMALIAAIIQWREARGQRKTQAGFIALYLGIVLVLCKSMGAIILTVVFAPMVAFLRARRIAAISAAACIVLLIYPAMRSAGLIPTATISAVTGSFSSDREGSLAFRLRNEDMLLQRRAEKPMFGWGSWGRNHVYSPDYGGVLTVTDGAWILTLGAWGWVGYLAMFGLLCLGSVRLLSRPKVLKSTSLASAALFAVLALHLLDNIPNASIRPFTWLLAGALLGVQLQTIARTSLRNENKAVGVIKYG